MVPAPAPVLTVPIPPGSEAVIAGQRVVMPGAPASLTYGMVRPEEVEAQKEEYGRNLDEQQRQGREALMFQTERHREFLRVQAEQQKLIAAGRWDQQLRAQEMQAEQEYQQELAKLREAARELKTALDAQAAQLAVEYHARKTQEELNYRIYEAELREWEEAQGRTADQIRNAEDRLQAQMAFAARRNTSSLRHADGLPEMPMDRWVPDGMGEVGAFFGGVGMQAAAAAVGAPAMAAPPAAAAQDQHLGCLAGQTAAHLAATNVSPYPMAANAAPNAAAAYSAMHSSAVY